MTKGFSKLIPMHYVKIKLPTQVEFASDGGVLTTLEGNVSYKVGDALMTGLQGERWPISRAKFELTYEPVPPTMMGNSGTYVKKRIVVEASQMDQPFEVTIRDGQSVIKGNAGDWVVSSPDGGQWVVADSIFKKTYTLADS
jgi:formylmethanofuran dehydrogenase subunit C